MKKQQVTAVIIVVLVAVIVGAKIFLGPQEAKIAIEMAKAKGNPEAKVKIVEFMDFQCPACANGMKVLKELLEKHPQDVHVQVKHFPLSHMHRHAMTSALYSECAGRQGKFWAFSDVMLPQQAQWSQLINAEPVFLGMAEQVGMDKEKLNSCLTSHEARQLINDEKSLGQSLGVSSTPTYFINNKMVVGVKSLEEELKIHFPD